MNPAGTMARRRRASPRWNVKQQEYYNDLGVKESW